MLKDALTLARASNLPTVWTNCLAAWAINLCVNERIRDIPEWKDLESFDPSLAFFLLLGASLIYAGGCTLNDAFDQKFDARYNPERPIPSGKISLNAARMLGSLELVVGSWLMISLAGCETGWTVSLAGCIIIYNAIHKKWAGGVWFMGGCRLLLWASAATCGDEQIVFPLTWVFGASLGLYIVGISLFARGEAKKEKFAPKISILLLYFPPMVALAALIYWNNLDPTRIFLVNLTGILIGWIVFRSISIIREGEEDSIGKGVSNLLAGICMIDGMFVCFCIPSLAAFLLLGTSFAFWTQKKFAAT